MAESIQTTYEQELKAAIDAAKEAGSLIRERAGKMDDRAVRVKGTNDLVTEVDEAVQELIIRKLQETFPQSRFLAEEGEEFSEHLSGGGYLWIIDPIDGTTNFMHGVPPFAVSIALCDAEEIVVGVVLDASRDELFAAARGGGLLVDGEPLNVSPTGELRDGLITTGFPYREMAHLDEYLTVLGEFMRKSRGVRRPGSASIDLAYVASGRFDGFFETGLKSWDVAAGILLIEEAGGRVTNYRNEPNPLFEKQILASNGRIHDEMLAIVRPMRNTYL